MHKTVLVITLVISSVASAFAQKAEIEAANAKWTEFFTSGDFAGIASLYTDDATTIFGSRVMGPADFEALGG